MEPATLKTAAAVAAVAALGPLLGEYAFILCGAFAGALLSLQLAEPMPGWWRPLAHVGAGITAALVFSSAATAVAAVALPAAWNITADILWLPVSALIAIFWRTALTWASTWASKRITRGDDQ